MTVDKCPPPVGYPARKGAPPNRHSIGRCVFPHFYGRQMPAPDGYPSRMGTFAFPKDQLCCG